MDNESQITLGVLNAVHEHQSPTQRSIAHEVGIALGLANSYLKRCIKKGYVKITQAPANRYMYYLTPQGFAEKSRLTAEYLSQSFSLFRQARAQYSDAFEWCSEKNFRKVALWGCGDLCEVAVLCAHEQGIDIVGIVDTAAAGEKSLGFEVVVSIGALPAVQAVILTAMRDPHAALEDALRVWPEETLLVPKLFGLDRGRRFNGVTS